MEDALDEVGGRGRVLARVRVVASSAFELGCDAVPGHEPHDAFGAHADAPPAQRLPYAPVAVASVALLERVHDGFEQVLVLVRLSQTPDVVVERAATQPEPFPQVPWPHGEYVGQVQHQTGLLTVGQVVRVCARFFSQQLPGVSDGLHLDLELEAFGAQGRQLRGEFIAFPAHVLDRRSRTGCWRRIVPLRLRPALSVPIVHPRLLVVVREHGVLPVSHDIGAHTQPLADLTARAGAAHIRVHRPAARGRVHGSPPDPAPSRLQLIDPPGQQRLARVAQRTDRARGAPSMLQVMVDGLTLLSRGVAFPTPIGERAAVVPAGLDPCPMPARQHLPGRIPQLVDHRRRAAIVLLVQPHRTKPLLPRVPHHQWTPFPLKSPIFLHHLKTAISN